MFEYQKVAPNDKKKAIDYLNGFWALIAVLDFPTVQSCSSALLLISQEVIKGTKKGRFPYEKAPFFTTDTQVSEYMAGVHFYLFTLKANDRAAVAAP